MPRRGGFVCARRLTQDGPGDLEAVMGAMDRLDRSVKTGEIGWKAKRAFRAGTK